jgi:hypothetical protein
MPTCIVCASVGTSWASERARTGRGIASCQHGLISSPSHTHTHTHTHTHRTECFGQYTNGNEDIATIRSKGKHTRVVSWQPKDETAKPEHNFKASPQVSTTQSNPTSLTSAWAEACRVQSVPLLRSVSALRAACSAASLLVLTRATQPCSLCR